MTFQNHNVCITSCKALDRRFHLEVYNLSCADLSGRLKQLDCVLKKFDIGNYGIDINFMLNRQLAKNAEIRVLSHLQRGNKAAVTFLDLTVNTCNILNQAPKIPLTKKILTELRKKSNIPRQCPLKGVRVFCTITEFRYVYLY